VACQEVGSIGLLTFSLGPTVADQGHALRITQGGRLPAAAQDRRRQGGVAALEIMHGTPAVANLIREGKTFQIPSIIQTAKRDGMQLMDQHLLDLLKTRQVSPEEVYRCCQDKKQFEMYLK